MNRSYRSYDIGRTTDVVLYVRPMFVNSTPDFYQLRQLHLESLEHSPLKQLRCCCIKCPSVSCKRSCRTLQLDSLCIVSRRRYHIIPSIALAPLITSPLTSAVQDWHLCRSSDTVRPSSKVARWQRSFQTVVGRLDGRLSGCLLFHAHTTLQWHVLLWLVHVWRAIFHRSSCNTGPQLQTVTGV